MARMINPELVEKRRLSERLKVRVSQRTFDYLNQVKLKNVSGLDSYPKIIDYLISDRIKKLKENKELKQLLSEINSQENNLVNACN